MLELAVINEETVDLGTPSGKEKWHSSTVESILTNEKYKGDARLQKSFTVDFLTKTKKTNESEVPQYYVENSHPPIIEPEEWEWVQTEIARRKVIGRRYSGKNVLASRIVCGECGEYFRAKLWHSTDKYKRTVWRCNNKFNGDKKCTTPTLDENDIKKAFLTAFNILVSDIERLLEDCRLIQSELTDCSVIDQEINRLLQEITVVTELTKKCVEDNSRTEQDQEAYTTYYNSLVERYETARTAIENLQSQREHRLKKADSIGAFMFELKEYDSVLEEFDDRLWIRTIDTVTVCSDGKLIFKFQNGAEIEV